MSALQIDALWSGINNPTSGKSYSGAIVATFASGTSTPKAVWEDKDETLPSALGKSQFTLDSNGQAFVFGSGIYKINIYAPTDTGLTNPLITIDGAEYMTATSKTLVLSNYDCNLETAIAAIGSVTKTHLIVDCSPDDLTGNLTSTENITLEYRAGYPLGGAFTLTINGALIAGNYRIFEDELSIAGSPIIKEWNANWNGVLGDGSTNNTAQYQKIITWSQAGIFQNIIFPSGDYVFLRASGRTTCVFLSSDTTDFQAEPLPINIDGPGRIVIDNDAADIVWMSGPPDDEVGVTAVNDVNVSGLSFISKSVYDTPAERTTYDDPNTTLPNTGIVFNMSRWWRSKFDDMHFEFVRGFQQAPDAISDSTGTFTQQLDITNNVSTHHQGSAINQGGFISFSSSFALNVDGNIIERGNGAIDLQRSSGISGNRVIINNNTIQANSIYIPVKCNFFNSLAFTNNYMESNRISAGVAIEQFSMAANSTASSLVFEGNFFSQSVTNLDGFGAAYFHVRVDGMDNFFPKGNTFSGGNAYRMIASTGTVFALNDKIITVGSIYTEQEISTGIYGIAGLDSSKPWTPVLSDAVTGGNLSPTAAINANYVRSGKLVTISAQFNNIDTTGMTGGNTLFIQGFPVASIASSIFTGSCYLEAVAFTDMATPFLTAGATSAQIRISTTAAADASLTVAGLTTGSADIIFTITYIID